MLGGGELGGMLQEHFTGLGYTANLVNLVFKRRGGVKIKDMEAAGRQLDGADFVINLLPTGEDFLHCGVTDFLKEETSIIDFSRPAISREKLQAKVYMGNRVQRPGLRFAFALPGWRQKELPACSLPSILAANYGIVEQNLAKFCTAARRVSFETTLAATVQPAPAARFAGLYQTGNEFMTNCRLYLFSAVKNVRYAIAR